MHKNARPPAEKMDSPEKRKDAKTFPLLEGDLGISGQVRKLIAIRGRLLASHFSDKKKAIAFAEGHLKNNGLIGADDSIREYKDAIDLVERQIQLSLREVNMRPPDSGMMEDRDNYPGKLFRGDSYCLLVSGDSDAIFSDPRISRVLEIFKREAGQFRTNTPYLANMHIDGETIGIQINHGKHKGYVALFFPEDPDLPYVSCFIHFEHGLGSYSKNRILFIEDVLGGLNLPIDVDSLGRDGFQVSSLVFAKDGLGHLLSTFFRLSRAVKDLDITLSKPRYAKCASMLFRKGVTNLVEAMALVTHMQDLSDDLSAIPLNDHEKDTLSFLFSRARFFLNQVRWLSICRDELRMAKDLNFQILEIITKLQLHMISCRVHGRPLLKREVNAALRQMRQRVMEMAKICDQRFSQRRENEYSRKAGEIMERAGYLVKDCTSWVLDEADSRSVMGMFADRGGELCMDSVATVEELVRFLHSQIISFSGTIDGYTHPASNLDGLYLLDSVEMLSKRFFCVNASQCSEIDKLEAYWLLRSTVRDVENPTMLMDGFAIAILGSDFAQISMPMGKHYSEISADLDHKGGCFGIRLQYFDTTYKYSLQRKKMVMLVLKNLGFELDGSSIEGTMVRAAFRTQDYVVWKKAYSELVRLMLSVEGLDLNFFDPKEAKGLFIAGFSQLSLMDLFMRDLDSPSDEGMGKGLQNILSNHDICQGDRRAYTNLFFSCFAYLPSRIIPLIRDYSIRELDQVICYAMDLEFKAKEKKDKKLQGRLKRLGAKIDKLIEEKEKGK